MSQKSAYVTLNLRKGATEEEIKQSYLSLVKRYDPERHTERFMVIQKAFERLSSPEKRAQEDILAFNPAKGQFQFLDEEKEALPDEEIAKRLEAAEAFCAAPNGSEEAVAEASKSLMLASAHHIRRKQYQKAIEYWERILRIDPSHPRAKNNLIFAYCSLAFSYAEHELTQEAINLWIRASEMNPDDGATLHNLALACENEGRAEEAQRYWNETLRRWRADLERNPDDEYLKNCILEVHRHHGGKLLDTAGREGREAGAEAKQQAVKSYEEILKINPDDFEANYQVAASHMENRRWNEAVEQLKAMMRKFPKNVEVLNLLGWAMLNSGQIDPAFMVWRQSATIDPKNPSTKDNMVRAHLQLGKKCREQGQFNTALKHFKSLLRILGPRNPEVHFEIGSTYYMKGDRRAAYLSFQDVLKLDPKNQNAKRLLAELRMR
ncbi:MAG: photosystem I assembly protein Ycf3 [candidate division BRC1 bacterium ADurb.BinA364]|nr:MAG: photosystem I assembly protein Ycf3 [candidate division BRC1 bacterium ADurb.BinA364]